MLAWLSVWSEMQTCIWPSWCHCHSLSLASVKSRLCLPFLYRLTGVVPDKRAVKRVCVCVCVCSSHAQMLIYCCCCCCCYCSLFQGVWLWSRRRAVCHWTQSHGLCNAGCSSTASVCGPRRPLSGQPAGMCSSSLLILALLLGVCVPVHRATVT